MVATNLIRDAVALRFQRQGAKLDEILEMGITRDEMDTFLDRRLGYARVDTVVKLRNWLNVSDDEVAELARIYRLGIIGNDVYEMLTKVCRTDEEIDEAIENIKDYLDEIKPIAKGRL